MATITFALVADVQYTDAEDRQTRRYRSSLKSLKEAITEWNECEHLSFVIQLGDVIDSFTRTKPETCDALKKVLHAFGQLKEDIGIVHVIGNHELYNLSRTELANTALCPKDFLANSRFRRVTPTPITPGRFYCSFEIDQCRDIVFVVLDTYEVSALDPGADKYEEAMETVTRYNKNLDLDSSEGLEGYRRRYTLENGAVGKEQLQWLDEVLSNADNNEQMVILFSHTPIHPDCGNQFELVWDYKEVLSVLWRHRSVKVSFSGHQHKFGYCQDQHGIHHRSIEALLEAPAGETGVATVQVCKERILIKGKGCVRTQVLDFDKD